MILLPRTGPRTRPPTEKLGFTLYKDNVCLLGPATAVADERRAALRAEFEKLCSMWRESVLTAVQLTQKAPDA